RQARLKLQAQPFEADAGEIRIIGMKTLQRRQQAALELQPDRRRQREHALARRCFDDAQVFVNGLRLRLAERAVARARVLRSGAPALARAAPACAACATVRAGPEICRRRWCVAPWCRAARS